MPTGRGSKKANVRRKGPARKIAKPVRYKYRYGYAYDARRDRILKVGVSPRSRMPEPFAPLRVFHADATRWLPVDAAAKALMAKAWKAMPADFYV